MNIGAKYMNDLNRTGLIKCPNFFLCLIWSVWLIINKMTNGILNKQFNGLRFHLN